MVKGIPSSGFLFVQTVTIAKQSLHLPENCKKCLTTLESLEI